MNIFCILYTDGKLEINYNRATKGREAFYHLRYVQTCVAKKRFLIHDRIK
jgi:hypothetical protein